MSLHTCAVRTDANPTLNTKITDQCAVTFSRRPRFASSVSQCASGASATSHRAARTAVPTPTTSAATTIGTRIVFCQRSWAGGTTAPRTVSGSARRGTTSTSAASGGDSASAATATGTTSTGPRRTATAARKTSAAARSACGGRRGGVLTFSEGLATAPLWYGDCQ